MREVSPRSSPGKRPGSGSSPTHNIDPLRACAPCSISTKVMAADCRDRPQSPDAQTQPSATGPPRPAHARVGPQLAGDEAGREQLPAADVPRDLHVARAAAAGRGAAGAEGAVLAAAPPLA